MQNAVNVDTGENEKLFLEDTCTEVFGIYEGKNVLYVEDIEEKIIKWKEEKGLERAAEFDNSGYDGYFGKGWCFPSYSTFMDFYDLGNPVDLYYAYELKNPTAPVTINFNCMDNSLYEDEVFSSTKPTNQVMTIDAEKLQ